MKANGRPLRFLAWLVGGWICLRAAMLMPPLWQNSDHQGQLGAHSLPHERKALPRSASTIGDHGMSKASTAWVAQAGQGSASQAVLAKPPLTGSAPFASTAIAARTAGFTSPVATHELANHSAASQISPTAGPATTPPVLPSSTRTPRWSGTAWLLWRPEAGSGAAFLPLLGGSQAGVRIDYRVVDSPVGQLSLYGRASRALAGASAEEAALGLSWRPAASPVSLLVERRQRLGPGGRNGFAVFAAGGLGPHDVAPRLEAEGYVQAGIVGLPGRDGFIDGKASLGYRVMPAPSRASLTFGASLAASVQPGAQRLDLGPELRLRLPTGQGGLRLSAEWRARIAGKVRPASGPAMTLIADF